MITKNCGVILNEDFDDAVWRLSDQTKNIGLKLFSFECDYNKNAMTWIGCDYYCYQNCIKAYISFNLGEIGLSTLQDISHALSHLAEKTIEDAIGSNKYINHITGLLQIIPGGSEKRDYVIEALEEKLERRNCNRRSGKQRRLADFNTYLRFNKVMNEFWKAAGCEQKLFYFSLYFWWNLTAILPLRSTEFLLTPRDCLETDNNGNNILTVRRTKMKGGLKKISYRIVEDYACEKYVIHENLAKELRSYLKATENMNQTEINTLFLQSPHFEYICRKGYVHNRYYTYNNLLTCLKYFYQEAVPLSDGAELGSVNLGDTRHLAMANLIISGGSPVICRELAGHSDIDISSHYYSNISNLVECVTLERYRKSKGESAEIIGTPKYAIALPETRYRVLDGWCDAPSIKEGDISDCLKVSGKQGQIGSCVHCVHYWPDDQGIRLKFLDERIGKQEIDADCRYLMRMIESVRRGIGYEEDIGAALLRLQRSSDHYSRCLWEKYMKADDKPWHGHQN